MSRAVDVYSRLRCETLVQLGFDAATLTPSQEARLAMVCGLKLEADRLAATQLKGLPVDPKAILVVGEALEEALRRPEASSPSRPRSEARERLKALIDATILAGPPTDEPDEPTRSELEAEIERLREELALALALALAQAGAVPAAAMPSADIVPLRPAPAPTPSQPAPPDAQSKAQLAYSERLQKTMTRSGTPDWQQSFSTGRGIHDIPRGF
jgi:hypothetical protein